MKNIIFYELNEVPLSVLKKYCDLHPHSTLSKIARSGNTYTTLNSDTGHLSPWITWPTLHRGVNNTVHKITDFGQDTSEIDKTCPNFFQILAESGISVGVFGSLHTFPMPRDLSAYRFYVPDTFAGTADTHPPKYRHFQSLNLYLTSRNGRNVSRKLPVAESLQFMVRCPALGVTGRTVWKLSTQLLDECRNRARVSRRRISQAQIAFDMYFDALRHEKPQISTFFTNHVASSMHRYWPATFPEHYSTFRMPPEWQETFRDEIWYAMSEVDHQLSRLVRFTRDNPDYALVVASSMGQAAVDDVVKVENQLLLKKPAALMDCLGLQRGSWHQKLAMEPQYVFGFESSAAVKTFLTQIESLKIRDQHAETIMVDQHTVRIAFGHGNFSLARDCVSLQGKSIDPVAVGLEIVPIQDQTGSYAYHIPEGLLLVYNGTGNQPSGQCVDTTEIAPAILKNFGVRIPAHMKETSLVI